MSKERSISRRTCLKIFGSLAAVPGCLGAAGDPAFAQGLPAVPGLDPEEGIPSLCDLCFWRCGLRAQVRDGRILRIRGNPNHPRSRGRLCARGISGRHQVQDPDRLVMPLRRVGERGEGRFEPISWDAALDLWAEKTRHAVETQGPGSIGMFSHGLSSRFINAFMLHIGNPNRTAPSFGQCRGPRDIGFQLTFGEGPGSPERHDMASSRMVVLLGCHIGENVQTGQVAEFAEALSRGARLVVADPRMSVAAGKADRWLRIRPGTDTALVLAWIRLLLEWDDYDKEYIRQYARGLEELRQGVAQYTPQWASEVTQIPREQIVEAAKDMARLRPAVLIHCGRSSAWYGNDTQRARSVAILTALLGAWGRPGGYFLPSQIEVGPRPCPPAHGPMGESVASGQHAFTRFGVAGQELVEASIGPSPRIRQWLLYASNPLQNLPDPARTRVAMAQLDFITMVDIVPTDCALWADLILPEATYLERWDDLLAVGDHPRPFVALRQPVVPPAGEARGPYWIVQQLAHRLGHTDCFTHADVRGYLAARLAPLGIELDALARTGIQMLDVQRPFIAEGAQHRFPTQDGRIALYSQHLEKHGYDPVPAFEPVEQPPAGWFRLVSGRSPYHSFARTQNLARLTDKKGENRLWLNDEVATTKGLNSGDAVWLQNQAGTRCGPVRILATPGIRTDVVFTEHGFGALAPELHVACGRGASDNHLLGRYAVDPPTGATGLRVSFVQLVYEDGVEVQGETAQCAKERAPLPVLPPRPPITPPGQAEPDCLPSPDGFDPGESSPGDSFDDFLQGNLEDSC